MPFPFPLVDVVVVVIRIFELELPPVAIELPLIELEYADLADVEAEHDGGVDNNVSGNAGDGDVIELRFDISAGESSEFSADDDHVLAGVLDVSADSRLSPSDEVV